MKPAPAMHANLRRLVDWVAAYTLSPPGAVLRMAMSSPSALEEPAAASGWRRVEGAEARITPDRAKALEILGSHILPGTEIARAAGVSMGVVRGMASVGLIEPALMARAAAFPRPIPDFAPPDLRDEQQLAANALREGVIAHEFGVTLLEGVTGSGKTEVYLDAVAQCLREGRQALVLLPEIALSTQWLSRFERRFGAPPALWHSELSSRTPPRHLARRGRGRRAGAGGRALGAVPALPDLGLIIVDEEHETAFKQEDGVIYHARDMAVVRARLESAACVLVSATPSLETVTNAQDGRYAHVTLPNRHHGASLPKIAALDLRQHPPERGRFLAPPLIQAVTETLARGEQAMLFLNRRGYAPLTLCRTCGHRMQCPNCTAWLVEHRAQRRLQCHHCGHTEPTPLACVECGTEHSLVPIGPGVERIQEEVSEIFPEARRLIMASDTIPGPAAAAEAARRIEEREVDLIIGTQIVAKGWHFPHLTLVGVVDADLGPRRRRPACRRADHAAAAPGRRPGGARGVHARHGAAADVCARPPGDDGARRRRHGWLPQGRIRPARAGPLAALRPAGRTDRQQRGPALGGARRARPGTGRADGTGDPGARAGAGAAFRCCGTASAPVAAEGRAWNPRAASAGGLAGRAQIPRDVRVQVDVDPVGFL